MRDLLKTKIYLYIYFIDPACTTFNENAVFSFITHKGIVYLFKILNSYSDSETELEIKSYEGIVYLTYSK